MRSWGTIRPSTWCTSCRAWWRLRDNDWLGSRLYCRRCFSMESRRGSYNRVDWRNMDWSLGRERGVERVA